MKHSTTLLFLAGLLCFVALQGFECSSPDMTGAKVYLQQKNLKDAARLLENEVKKNPGNHEAWMMLGRIRTDEQNYEAMNYAFDQAQKITPQYNKEIHDIRYSRWGYHLNQGVDYLNRGSKDSMQNYDKSIHQFQRAIAAWPDTSLTYRYMGFAYKNKGDIDSCMINLQIAWTKGKDLDAIKIMGAIYLEKGVILKDEFERANEKEFTMAGRVHELKTNKNLRPVDVRRYFGEPDKITKGPKKTLKEEWVYTALNLTLKWDGDKLLEYVFSKPYVANIDSTKYRQALVEFDKAIEKYELGRKSYPNENDLLVNLMKAYVQANRLEQAIATFQIAVDNDPNNVTNRYILGVLLRSGNQYEKAVVQFKKVLEADPEYYDAVYELGATYYNWGVEFYKVAQEKGDDSPIAKEKFREALPHFEKIASLFDLTKTEKERDPNGELYKKLSTLKFEYDRIYATLGTIYLQLGEEAKGRAAMEKSEKIAKGEL